MRETDRLFVLSVALAIVFVALALLLGVPMVVAAVDTTCDDYLLPDWWSRGADATLMQSVSFWPISVRCEWRRSDGTHFVYTDASHYGVSAFVYGLALTGAAGIAIACVARFGLSGRSAV